MRLTHKAGFGAGAIRIAVSVVLTVVSVGSAVLAAEPSYYVKKDTWQETIRASCDGLDEFNKRQAIQQADKLEALGIELGPWYTVGPFFPTGKSPFEQVFGPQVDADLDKTYEGGKLKWTARPEWKDGAIHRLPGHGRSGEGLTVANYLFRNIKASQQAALPVYLGSNDGLQVWFNGKKVLTNDIGRSAAPDQDIIKLDFKKGANELLLKVSNRARAHAFYFSMHPARKTRPQQLSELWKLVTRHFPDEKAQRQIRWERQDKIWDAPPQANNFGKLADLYAEAAKEIETLASKAKQLAEKTHTLEQLQKVRQVYYLSKRHGARIKAVREKMNTMQSQFKYLSRKYPQYESQWKSYKARLESLRQTIGLALDRARKGDDMALNNLPQTEMNLEQEHKSMLPPLSQPPKSPRCAPFALKQVKLLDGPFKQAAERDRRYLHDLDSDRLLHMFRITASLPSSAKQLGGWEKRELRGHTMGHYLSACALMYAGTGDEKLKAKADAIVAELAKCQDAFGNGYLSAFPEEGIKRVIYGTGDWWAPWYTLHKIYAGLLDMYEHCDNAQALEVAGKMADWAKSHLDNLTDEQDQRMLEVEYGGMNEVLCNLYAVTRDPNHLALAKRFDHKRIFDPLSNFEDRLKGLHANTQIPKIAGAARMFELTGEPYYYNIATFFWDQIVDARSYCTGGTSNHEHWRTAPGELAAELSPATQETCCTYNMLKLSRHIFAWSAQPQVADYYERALFNSILSTQDPETGMMMYFVPLEAGYWKLFNLPNDSFWCCTGTGLENHAKYGDSIYFHNNDDTLFVNLFIASQLNWPEKGIRLRQETNFPEQQGTTITMNTEKPLELALRIRVPYWARQGVTVTINGRPRKVKAQPTTYVTLRRKWQDGDTVKIQMPMSLHLHRMPDDPTLAAIMYGPLVLVGELGSQGLTREIQSAEIQRLRPHSKDYPVPTFTADTTNLDTWIKPVKDKPLTFTTAGAGSPNDVTLVPLHRLFGQRYAVYWRIKDNKSARAGTSR